ncbi:hypothetical protein [Nocardia sp. NPDC051463]|uniref:hypothetical protein n=1 Tax=Nocardia sp. NPDC051463 TaxID=3154845 RepID=UPI00344C5AE0
MAADGTDHVIVIDRFALVFVSRSVLSQAGQSVRPCSAIIPPPWPWPKHAVHHRVEIPSAALNDPRADDWSALASGGGHDKP